MKLGDSDSGPFFFLNYRFFSHSIVLSKFQSIEFAKSQFYRNLNIHSSLFYDLIVQDRGPFGVLNFAAIHPDDYSDSFA